MATLTLRYPEKEKEILLAFCKKTGRNQTDVIREFIRSLESKN
jgi:predicted DNA-binding protein